MPLGVPVPVGPDGDGEAVGVRLRVREVVPDALQVAVCDELRDRTAVGVALCVGETVSLPEPDAVPVALGLGLGLMERLRVTEAVAEADGGDGVGEGEAVRDGDCVRLEPWLRVAVGVREAVPVRAALRDAVEEGEQERLGDAVAELPVWERVGEGVRDVVRDESEREGLPDVEALGLRERVAERVRVSARLGVGLWVSVGEPDADQETECRDSVREAVRLREQVAVAVVRDPLRVGLLVAVHVLVALRVGVGEGTTDREGEHVSDGESVLLWLRVTVACGVGDGVPLQDRVRVLRVRLPLCVELLELVGVPTEEQLRVGVPLALLESRGLLLDVGLPEGEGEREGVGVHVGDREAEGPLRVGAWVEEREADGVAEDAVGDLESVSDEGVSVAVGVCEALQDTAGDWEWLWLSDRVRVAVGLRVNSTEAETVTVSDSVEAVGDTAGVAVGLREVLRDVE